VYANEQVILGHQHVRIAVISDVHAAHAPFAAALSAARGAGFDQLILLGDMFTYGMNPVECADLAFNAIDKDGAVLIGGNHDQLYIDLEHGQRDYYDRLPDWIRESVEWTWDCLGKQWPDTLPCVAEWRTADLLLAHANPFGYGDWTYLSNEDSLGRAASVCAEQGVRYGVFGHLHRAVNHSSPAADIHVIGSIGQPRSRDDQVPHWAMLDLTDEGLTVTRHNVPFDATAHCAEIRCHPALSEKTKTKLCGYFE
jgi:Calcineurin-like phosphoesterase superfamily domain